MSQKGKILRGEKWYTLYRNDDGTIADVIKNDPHKMIDVNEYLKAKKEAEEKGKTKSKEKK